MAKSKNHTAHNQSHKAHRNGIKKPRKHRHTEEEEEEKSKYRVCGEVVDGMTKLPLVGNRLRALSEDGQVEESHGSQPVAQGSQERHQEAQEAPPHHQLTVSGCVVSLTREDLTRRI
ncbi:hypothetical protein RJ640_014679 [Escallonia rubra]|uniref:60S ribosomal protein L29 n=1 Tax=Escallonia rubra TaxID=112253 RepID=A0AA88UV75_9ASTE|nr:hypothetical protein RJ640_014679 [Escallonia rubra]